MRGLESGLTRRGALKLLGLGGAAAFLGCKPKQELAAASISGSTSGFRQDLEARVFATPLADVHEHLPDEADRLAGGVLPCDDWSVLFSHYLDADLRAAGMPLVKRDTFLSTEIDPLQKWKLLEPFWPRLKNTGLGRAVRLSIRELYGIDDLEESVIPRLQSAYESLRKPGMYNKVLVETANIESCQVNSMGEAFHESIQPTLLMQDLSFQAMHVELDFEGLAGPAGIRVRHLYDWHEVIHWWFDTYATYAVAAKSQGAYRRGLDYDKVDASVAAPIFKKVVRRELVSPDEQKQLEDHLFWFCVEEAQRSDLPVKVHTGYLAGEDELPLDRLEHHPSQAAKLCDLSPETRFVFMHIAYPFWAGLIAVAKRYSNAFVDMSWAWILDPVASKEFLKSYLAAAPSSKLFPFGGDYIPVECVVGHAKLARQGIVQALSELADEEWIEREDALNLVEPLLRGNAQRVFRLKKKKKSLSQAPWA